MAANASNVSLTLCTRTHNDTCWYQRVSLIDSAYAKQMTPVIVMMVTFMVIGVFGNIIVIVMYRTQKKKTPANMFIVFLGGIDFFASVVIHPYVIYKLFNHFNQTWNIACKIFEYLVHLNLLMSGLALMLVAVDRFLSICKPVKYLEFGRHVLKSITLTVAVSVIASIPLLEFYGPHATKFEIENVVYVGYKCHYQEKYIGTFSMAAFSGFIMCGFIVVIVAMAVLYTHVAHVAYKRRRKVGPQGNSHTLAVLKPTSSLNAEPTPKSASLSVVTQKFDVSTCNSNTGKIRFTNATRQPMSHGQMLSNSEEINCINSSVTNVQAYVKDRNNTQTDSTSTTITLALLTAKRLKAANILFTVTFVFFLSWMPFFIIRICNTVSDNQCHPISYVGEIVVSLLNHLFYINNAINPILYSIINKNFRQDFHRMLRRRCC